MIRVRFIVMTLAVCLYAVMPISVDLIAKSTFSAQRLEDACRAYVRTIVGNNVEVSFPYPFQTIEFDEDGVSAKFASKPNMLKGNTGIRIEFVHNGNELDLLDIPVKISIYRKVPVARRNITKGETLLEKDFEYIQSDVTHLKESDFKEDENLIGSTVNKSIPKGSILTKTCFTKGKTINRGEKVIVIVVSGAVKIRATATALQDASAGDQVRVKFDGNIIQGIAADDGTVIIKNDIALN